MRRGPCLAVPQLRIIVVALFARVRAGLAGMRQHRTSGGSAELVDVGWE